MVKMNKNLKENEKDTIKDEVKVKEKSKIKEKSKSRTKEKLSSKTKDKNSKPSTRKNKLTKAQEAKKKIIFEKFKNRWTFAKLQYGDEERFCFMFHSPKDNGSVSKIQQIILTGDLLSDGIYEIQDYQVEEKFDARTRKDIIVLYVRKYELTYGKFADNDKKQIKDEKQLRKYLVDKKFLTTEQFDDFFYRNQLPENHELIELKLEFKNFN